MTGILAAEITHYSYTYRCDQIGIEIVQTEGAFEFLVGGLRSSSAIALESLFEESVIHNYD